MTSSTQGKVYFIQQQDGQVNPIKIGFSKHPAKRIKELKTASPYPLEVLATIEGTEKDERDLHKRFASSRLEGEWFSYTQDLLTYILELNSLSSNRRVSFRIWNTLTSSMEYLETLRVNFEEDIASVHEKAFRASYRVNRGLLIGRDGYWMQHTGLYDHMSKSVWEGDYCWLSEHRVTPLAGLYQVAYVPASYVLLPLGEQKEVPLLNYSRQDHVFLVCGDKYSNTLEEAQNKAGVLCSLARGFF